jgi:hypothetical protein
MKGYSWAGLTRFGDFFPIGLLLEAHYNFKKYLVAHRIDNVLGYFLLEQIYYIFTWIGSFKT